MDSFFNNYNFDELTYMFYSQEEAQERIKKLKRARRIVKLIWLLMPILTIYALTHGITHVIPGKLCIVLIVLEIIVAIDLSMRNGIFKYSIEKLVEYDEDFERMHSDFMARFNRNDTMSPGEYKAILREEKRQKQSQQSHQN